MRTLILLIVFLVLCVSAHALPVTWGIFGKFSDTVVTCFGCPEPVPPDPADYPFPELYGGHFDGVFSCDHGTYSETWKSATRLSMQSVHIDIYSNTNQLMRTIIEGTNNEFFSISGNKVFLYFGTSGGILNDIVDLRVIFDGNMESGTTFSNGFLETDETLIGSSWDLLIASSQLRHISSPIENIPPWPYANPVLEPAAMLLFGSVLVGLAVFGRKKIKKKLS